MNLLKNGVIVMQNFLSISATKILSKNLIWVMLNPILKFNLIWLIKLMYSYFFPKIESLAKIKPFYKRSKS